MLDNKQVATVTKKAVAGVSWREAGGDQGFFSAILILMRRCQRKMSRFCSRQREACLGQGRQKAI